MFDLHRNRGYDSMFLNVISFSLIIVKQIIYMYIIKEWKLKIDL